MDSGERTTGTRGEQYNLVSVLYHALKGAETIEAYTLDSEAAGDERLADFFREAQATYRQLAEQAKVLLGIGDVLPVDDVPPGTAPSGIDTSPRSTGRQPEGRTSPTTVMPGEDLAPPEEAFPPDTPSPPNEEQPPKSGPYRPGSSPPS